MPRRKIDDRPRGFANDLIRLVFLIVVAATAKFWLPIVMQVGASVGEAYGKTVVAGLTKPPAKAGPEQRPAR